MKKILITMSLFLLFFHSSASALELQKGPKLVKATPTTLEVEWDKVDKALGYYLYYGTVSGIGKGYEKTYTEFLESTGATIIDLDAGKNYYVALTVVDEAGTEGKYSPETMMKTMGAGLLPPVTPSSKLALQTVQVISAQNIELTFSNDLSADSTVPREFKLIDSQVKNEIVIKDSQVNGKKVQLSLASDLATNKKYDLTIINIQDVNGKSIESGVDGIASFTTPQNFESLVALNAASSETPPPLADMTPPQTPKDFSGNVGQSIEMTELQKNTEVAAETNDKLPKTGPEIFLVLLLSFLIGMGVFYWRRKVS